jgi:hypothetical protein
VIKEDLSRNDIICCDVIPVNYATYSNIPKYLIWYHTRRNIPFASHQNSLEEYISKGNDESDLFQTEHTLKLDAYSFTFAKIPFDKVINIYSKIAATNIDKTADAERFKKVNMSTFWNARHLLQNQSTTVGTDTRPECYWEILRYGNCSLPAPAPTAPVLPTSTGPSPSTNLNCG